MQLFPKKPLKFAVFPTKWGCFGLAANEKGLLRTVLPCPDRRQTEAILLRDLPGASYKPGLFKDLQVLVCKYFAGEVIEFPLDLPIVLDDLPKFTRQVLLVCRKISYGQIRTYAQIASAAGNPHAARAVGNALARNRLPLVIPCHRVICANGSLGGFSAPGGIECKKSLLELEGAVQKV